MSLSDYKVAGAIPVADMDKAKEFYEGKLGLSGGREVGDGGITYPCAEGTQIHPYPSPDNAGKSGATLAFWETDDFDKAVDDLTGSGVTFEQYDMDPIKTDERGVAELPDGAKVAWFKDPDGNILAVGTPT
jgi:catechol 2,3-dioxygenase-like lactoylglutathione lyase family enzyme